MSQKRMLQARGLYTDPNLLSKVPEGALVQADNVIIDRDGIVEPRRGFRNFANPFGDLSSRANQLIDYKDRLLVNYADRILFSTMDHVDEEGNFAEFGGTYTELEDGLRIKSVESNRNLFFTSGDGIKKISARTADDFTTDEGFITDAGGVKALDITGSLMPSINGFLPGNSVVGYKVVWGNRDLNDNLILGSDSPRLVINNFSDQNSNVDLDFVIPRNVTSSHFYQIYRTPVFTASGAITIQDLDPGEDMQLVFEEFPTEAELLDGVITTQDISPEDFRRGGVFLYTSPNSAEGILQANEPPPRAKDITMYQNTVFFANTESRARVDVSLLSVQSMVSGTSKVIIDDKINPPREYTFIGEREIVDLDFSNYTGIIPDDLDGKNILINAASDSRLYYLWFDNSITTQTLDFSGYVGSDAVELDGRYVVFHTNSENSYYVWFDSTGQTEDPGNINSNLNGFIGIRIDSAGLVTTDSLASMVHDRLVVGNVFNDYDSLYTVGSSTVTIETEAFDETLLVSDNTIQQGFLYSIVTPENSDPGNDLTINTDVAGRLPIKVTISRNVSSSSELADAVAASLLENDPANDFNISFISGTSTINITYNNNGNTGGIIDSPINPVGNGFSINILQQGDGEDSSLNQVLLSTAATPAQQIDESARSLVNIINRDPMSSVYAFYLSGSNDLPGMILFESIDIGTNQFEITADSSITGASFNPSLPPTAGAAIVMGEAEISPNRVFFSKLQQPEAVPLVNFIDIGPEDEEISRILALRESLFILKEDGIYRLTGLNGNFVVDLFDESTRIISPDSAVVLNNQIYCLTNQGVAVISDTGVNIISKQLDNVFQVITSSQYDFRLTSFGVSYETDRCYWLWVPSTTSDTVATQAFRYNTYTESWTRHPIAKTCGLVLKDDDKLYLGPSDANFIEIERKNFNRQDYADRQFDLNIIADGVDNFDVSLNMLNLAEEGDAIVQTQYLTINNYNNLLRRLDLDPFTGAPEEFNVDFNSYTGNITTDLDRKYFVLFSASDEESFAIILDTSGQLTSLNTLPFSDIRNASQIIVNISDATDLPDVVSRIQNTLRSSTLSFVVNYVPGSTEFSCRTVRNGETTNSFNSSINGISNGFSIDNISEGFGDYFNNLESVAGDNLEFKLTDLTQQLDSDPSVMDEDYLDSIQDYSAVGASVVAGNITVVTSVGHNLNTGRMIVLSNSTIDLLNSMELIITRIDNDTFSIDIDLEENGTFDYISDINTQKEIQSAYNTIINKLNLDGGVLYSDYDLSEGSSELEALILCDDFNSNVVEIEFCLNFVEGPVTIFKSIEATLLYAPEHFGDPSMMKQTREGTFMFENSTFSRGVIGYKSDLSPGIEEIPFEKSGKGDWGFFLWSGQNWGGGFSGVPTRTYVPRDKQRSRFVQAFYRHISARERWGILGLSYTYRVISERSYRE